MVFQTRPATEAACQLIHDGSIALAGVEDAGIAVDVPYLNRISDEVSGQISDLTARMKTGSTIYNTWQERFGPDLNLGSRDQLSTVLFDLLGYDYTGPPPKRDAKGKVKRVMDDAVLSVVPSKWVDAYLQLARLEKLRGTYINGILRHQWGGILHGVYNLHIARTYRSTASDPNFQNIPIRDPILGPMIRRAFLARPGHHLVEADFSGIEVHAAAWYHKDPTMLHYLATGYDMHKEQAGHAYCLDLPRVAKPIRQAGKGFVFAEFYGDWFASCAAALWKASESLLLDGGTVRDHLNAMGFTELGSLPNKPPLVPPPGTYMAHVKTVEDNFWNVTHPVYKQWRESHYARYQQEGGFSSLSGFRFEGEMSRNQVINYPVQGVAFHCLLWCLIRISQELEARGMRTRLIGQIHDSILADVWHTELQEYGDIIRRVMTEELPQHYRFICTTVEVEVEVTPVGGCWADKEKWN